MGKTRGWTGSEDLSALIYFDRVDALDSSYPHHSGISKTVCLDKPGQYSLHTLVSLFCVLRQVHVHVHCISRVAESVTGSGIDAPPTLASSYPWLGYVEVINPKDPIAHPFVMTSVFPSSSVSPRSVLPPPLSIVLPLPSRQPSTRVFHSSS